MPTTSARRNLRDLLDQRELIVAPGVFDGISEYLAKRTGHVAANMTGAGVAASDRSRRCSQRPPDRCWRAARSPGCTSASHASLTPHPQLFISHWAETRLLGLTTCFTDIKPPSRAVRKSESREKPGPSTYDFPDAWRRR
jgi:hypothetical protein